MGTLQDDAAAIVRGAIEENMPQSAVRAALSSHEFTGEISLVAIGKAAWSMARAACDELGPRIKAGVVITKYEHSRGDLPGIEIIEAGHPIADENSIRGTRKAIELAKGLGSGDELLFLISGGGSALFEAPLDGVSLDDLVAVNKQLLACGADIVEINMIRKRLSSVKAGRFAALAAPARVFTVVLSDVLGDRLDSIASGPAAPDMTTAEEAKAVVRKYGLRLSPAMEKNLEQETPKSTENVTTVITGSVGKLCSAAAEIADSLGYRPHLLCTEMKCEAREAGVLAAALARNIGNGPYGFERPCAILLGGETVVHLRGSGKGGRNQELVLAAAEGIAGIEDVLICSFGSDGTDGPTDAAGGMVDGSTLSELAARGINLEQALADNDAYTALSAIDRLIMTGPTGTNVNDVTIILAR